MLGSGPSDLVVLLASVLKPVDDTRMRDKFAGTLLQRPNTHVHVAGRRTGDDQHDRLTATAPRVHHHPIFWGSRLSWNRLAAQWRYWRLLRALAPTLVIVHAPELLPLTLLWHWRAPERRFLYDIRENYALNVSTQGVYQGFAQRLLTAGLRWVETLAARHAAAIVLAEESYAAELPFLKLLPASHVVVIENKYQPSPGEQLPNTPRPLPAPDEPIRLLFSGTISDLNGVREAIALSYNLNKTWPGGAELTIIGFCQQPELLGYLHVMIERLTAIGSLFITLEGGAAPVPHTAIVAAIAKANIGLLPYRPHVSTARCRPTKLFEYLAHGLPVLIPANPLWETLVRRHQAGLVIDFSQPARAATLIVAGLTSCYPDGLPTDVLWTSEAKKLRHLLESLR